MHVNSIKLKLLTNATMYCGETMFIREALTLEPSSFTRFIHIFTHHTIQTSNNLKMSKFYGWIIWKIYC